MKVLRALSGLFLVALPSWSWAQGIPAPTVQAAVLRHAVARGEAFAPEDFASEARGVAEARNTLAAGDMQGKEAVRDLPSGAMLRSGDVVALRLVRRGEPVIITIRTGGVSISTNGRALASGGAGDLVRVFAASTNRTLDGMVDGPGTVRIVAP